MNALLGVMLSVIAGSVNPAVTQDTINATICTPGWATSQRPPQAFTENLKRRAFYGSHAPGKLADWQWDHLVPLELGGCARCLDNMWLQPIAAAHVKDHQERALNRAVCAGSMPLLDAQILMRRWWRAP